MSWFQSICPRCHGLMYVPATFVGHSVVCDKCGVVFILDAATMAAPPAPAQPYLPPYGATPYGAPPYSGPPYAAPPPYSQQPGGYEQPGAYYPAPPPPPGYGAPPSFAPPPPYSSAPPPPVSPSETPPRHERSTPQVPQAGGRREHEASPFGSPLPEIEILPPPKATRQSSRKRSSASGRPSDSRRTRRESSTDVSSAPATPPTPPVPPRSSKRSAERAAERAAQKAARKAARRAPLPPVSQEAVQAAHQEVEDFERRLRRARQRRNVSLTLIVVGMLTMSLVGYLVMRFARPSKPSVPAPTASAFDERYPSDLPRS